MVNEAGVGIVGPVRSLMTMALHDNGLTLRDEEFKGVYTPKILMPDSHAMQYIGFTVHFFSVVRGAGGGQGDLSPRIVQREGMLLGGWV